MALFTLKDVDEVKAALVELHLVENAFGPGKDCKVRGMSLSEYRAWQLLAGQTVVARNPDGSPRMGVDNDRLEAIQVACCAYGEGDQRMFVNPATGLPTEANIAYLMGLPAGIIPAIARDIDLRSQFVRAAAGAKSLGEASTPSTTSTSGAGTDEASSPKKSSSPPAE